MLKFSKSTIRGIAANVPKEQIDNAKSPLFNDSEDFQKFFDTTGIKSRFVVGDSGICTSDLCFTAANRLIHDLGWEKETIDCLIFISQTPDYQLPATSCILQDRLGLRNDCFALDISLGCSGWVYGVSTAASFIETSQFKRVLLLVGDTTSLTKSPLDRSTYPLFGDAGTATAIEYDENSTGMAIDFGTDGSGYDSIIIKDGGYRNPTTEKSLKQETKEDGKIRNNLQSILNGAEVFTFGISRAPKSMKKLLGMEGLTPDNIDFLVLHQANKMMNDKIVKKVKIGAEKSLSSMENYGNTSSASIPLTICHHKHKIKHQTKFLACGFGVGLSWGSVIFDLDAKCKILGIEHND